MKYFTLLAILFFLTTCSNSTLEKELELANLQLEKAELTLAVTQKRLAQLQDRASGELTHIVFFKLKPDADQSAFIAEIKKLTAIEEVKDLEFGIFENLEDSRALSEYSMVMEMSFDNVEAYKKYQAHPVHLILKENAKAFLAGPPATYDYMKK